MQEEEGTAPTSPIPSPPSQVLNVSQESRQWLADPANRNCDVSPSACLGGLFPSHQACLPPPPHPPPQAPGSWYCVGQYPPALEKFRPPKTHRHLNYDDNKFVEDQH